MAEAISTLKVVNVNSEGVLVGVSGRKSLVCHVERREVCSVLDGVGDK